MALSLLIPFVMACTFEPYHTNTVYDETQITTQYYQDFRFNYDHVDYSRWLNLMKQYNDYDYGWNAQTNKYDVFRFDQNLFYNFNFNFETLFLDNVNGLDTTYNIDFNIYQYQYNTNTGVSSNPILKGSSHWLTYLATDSTWISLDNSNVDLLFKRDSPFLLQEDSAQTNIFNFVRVELVVKATTDVEIDYEDLSYDKPKLMDFENNFTLSFTSANDNYLNGYNVGYAKGQSDYSKEFGDSSYRLGYQRGYDDGLLAVDTNDIHLTDLTTAVATVPTTILGSIFNFDLFGVNILAVLTSLITLLVAIWLLKKFL